MATPWKMIRQKGKGSKVETLPNQRTLSQLTSPASQQRLASNYAKVTPSGVKAMDMPSIMEMATTVKI